jgi:hypothetical protein
MLTPVATAPAPYSTSGLTELDIQEVVQQFASRRPATGVRSIGSLLANVDTNDFGTTTTGDVTYMRVDPLREATVTADARLQKRLELLCETLRSKY